MALFKRDRMRINILRLPLDSGGANLATAAMREETYYYIRQRYEERVDIKFQGMGK